MTNLKTIDGETLMSKPLQPLNFVVDTLLSQGLHILAGSPKVGKSWLALWLAVTVAKGEPVWGMPVREGTTLYLCLEDSQLRIQNRLFDVTEDASANVHFCTESRILGDGLTEQLEQFLVELPARLTANAVYHQMVVEVVGVQVCRHHHLEVRELTLGQLQPDGVGLLRCEIICLSEGLHEVVELSAVGFLESLFCRHHLRVDGLRNAVVAGDKSESAGAGLLFLLDVFQYAAQHTSCLLLVFDRRERRHQSTSVRRLTCSQSTA